MGSFTGMDARETEDLFDLAEALISGALPIDEHHPLQVGGATRTAAVADDVMFVESFANSIVVRTDDGLVMVDAGGPLHAGAIHDAVRAWSAAPLHTAVYTHGHVDHIYAVANFESETGGGPARVIAHELVPERFHRYDLTRGYNGIINQRQFQLGGPFFPSDYRYPDLTYRDHLDVEVGGTRFELRHDRGETDDGTWVWLPEHKVLCTGDLFIWASPNCGNPQKVQRYCDEWAIALRKMAALGAEVLLPGHGLPIRGTDRVRGALEDSAELLESLFTQTITMMNTGARLDEIIHTVEAPAHLLERPWLQPVYDEPEFIVRNIWRLYGGWYGGNPAELKPATEAALAAELASLAGGAQVLADRALAVLADGDERLAGHLAEMAALAAPDDPGVWRVRAEVFGQRARSERSTMAKGVFRWAENDSKAHTP